jgi:membrane-associated phospholipid phosphatase
MKNVYVFLLFFSISTANYSQNVDIDFLRHVNVNRNENFDPAFAFITHSVTPLSIAVPAGAITYAFIKKDDQSIQDAVEISSSVILSGIISLGLKHTVNRERPFETYPFIEQATSVTTASFPSGHTTHAFALATSVSLVYPQWYIIAPSYLWAGAVGYSRMHLGVHYPSDVLAGAIIGSGSAYLCHKINQKIKKNYGGIKFYSSIMNDKHVQFNLIIPLN